MAHNILDRVEFSKWLADKLSYERVGATISVYDCPISNFIRETGKGKSCRVLATIAVVDYRNHEMATWAQDFVTLLDDYGKGAYHVVTAYTALKVLSQVKN